MTVELTLVGTPSVEHRGNANRNHAFPFHVKGTSRWTVFQRALLSLCSSWWRLHSAPYLPCSSPMPLEGSSVE